MIPPLLDGVEDGLPHVAQEEELQLPQGVQLQACAVTEKPRGSVEDVVQAKGEQFFMTPNPDVGGRIPIELARSEEGAIEVENLVRRLSAHRPG